MPHQRLLLAMLLFTYFACLGWSQKSQPIQKNVSSLKYRSSPEAWLETRPSEEQKIIKELQDIGLQNGIILSRLAVQGIGAKQVKVLKEHGLDLLKNPAPKDSIDYRRLFVLSECVAIGVVEDVAYDSDQVHCYHTKVKIRILEYLKHPPALGKKNTIFVLLGSGPSGNKLVSVSEELHIEKGATYLFILSNIHYRYYLESHLRCSDEYRDNYFVTSSLSPRVLDGELIMPVYDKREALSKFKASLRQVMEDTKR